MKLVPVDPKSIPPYQHQTGISRVKEALALIENGQAVTDNQTYPDAKAARKMCNGLLTSLYRYKRQGRTESGFGSRVYENKDGWRWAILPTDKQ